MHILCKSLINSSYFILIILFLFPVGVVYSQEDQQEIRRFNKHEIENYQNSDSFFYLDNTNSKTDYEAMFYSWMSKMFSSIFGSKAGTFLLKNIHYLLFFLALILVLYKITDISFSRSSYKVNSKKYSDNFDDIEHVEKVDFDALISEALSKNNYRMAIRYQYLNMIKKLSVAGYIIHSPHKTNVEYTYELKDVKLRDSFRQIAFIFDYVWYGENKLSNSTYVSLQSSFTGFEDVLGNTVLLTKE